ncbi:hypothetical protein FGO68_gene1380 [Halteria grandinella]|uniref:Uncharacterized protein n=1 Tax=Halteria grandinella TaxID=5974 RepID=A0A8J8T003_HALGN|nr:hypothetical protein FGO68_gene1380 [Halteria grandinella]
MQADLDSYHDLATLDDTNFLKQYEQELVEIDPERILEDPQSADFILKLHLMAVMNQAFKETGSYCQNEIQLISSQPFDKSGAAKGVKEYIYKQQSKSIADIKNKIDRLVEMLQGQSDEVEVKYRERQCPDLTFIQK